jgi:hypothetical protein
LVVEATVALHQAHGFVILNCIANNAGGISNLPLEQLLETHRSCRSSTLRVGTPEDDMQAACRTEKPIELDVIQCFNTHGVTFARPYFRQKHYVRTLFWHAQAAVILQRKI